MTVVKFTPRELSRVIEALGWYEDELFETTDAAFIAGDTDGCHANYSELEAVKGLRKRLTHLANA